MAQKTLIQLIDDLDGNVIDDGEGRTVLFSFNGASYEIDLSETHAAELAAILAPYRNAGRRTGRKSVSPSTGAKTDPTELQKIREWARSNGHEVSDRGRVSGAIREAFRAAN